MVSYFKMYNLIHSMEVCKQNGTPFYPFDKEEIKAMLAMPGQALLNRLPVYKRKTVYIPQSSTGNGSPLLDPIDDLYIAYTGTKSEVLNFLVDSKERYGVMRGGNQCIVVVKEA